MSDELQSDELTLSPTTKSTTKGSKKSSIASDRPRQRRPNRVLPLYEFVTITVLILGVIAFARSSDCTLLYIACAMAGIEAGVPVVDFVKEILRRGGSGKLGS